MWCTNMSSLSLSPRFTSSPLSTSLKVALVNADGSVDIVLSDGRRRQDVPLQELRFVARARPPLASEDKEEKREQRLAAG